MFNATPCISEETAKKVMEQEKNTILSESIHYKKYDKEDFKGFIGEDMRLTPVTCSDDTDVEKTIKFYMGANTPERKDYIMDSLVCDSSEF